MIGYSDICMVRYLQFHPSVNLGAFHTRREITLVPPDGDFELMTYRSSEGLEVPFSLHTLVREVRRSPLLIIFTIYNMVLQL